MGARHGLARRGFLQGSLALATARVPRLARPSDEWRVAVVGVNGRGAEHAAALRALPGVRLVALCDVDERVAGREARRLRERELRVDVHSDLRDVLEREDVDALVIATPDHWHALQVIWACQAGKDVYVEMPATHTFAEGAPLVAAAQKYGRVVQCGLPARASPAIRAAVEWMRAGHLGALELVRGLHYAPQLSIGRVNGNQRIPEFVNYDLWCGPSPLVPLRRTRLHGDWRWRFATGSGGLGSGAQAFDLARWVLGAEELPASVLSLGVRAGYADDGETPNTQVVFLDYEPAPLLFEVRGLPRDQRSQVEDWVGSMDDFLGVQNGVVAHCSGGTLRIPSASVAIACDGEGAEIRRWEEDAGDDLAGWIEACTKRGSDLAAGIEVGVRSSALLHLGNASHRLGRVLAREQLLAELGSSARLTETAAQVLAHLDVNGIDLQVYEPVLGPCLFLDHGTGLFRENERANALLAGSYREPFVLPESI